jgi:hypothetical protein
MGRPGAGAVNVRTVNVRPDRTSRPRARRSHRWRNGREPRTGTCDALEPERERHGWLERRRDRYTASERYGPRDRRHQHAGNLAGGDADQLRNDRRARADGRTGGELERGNDAGDELELTADGEPEPERIGDEHEHGDRVGDGLECRDRDGGCHERERQPFDGRRSRHRTNASAPRCQRQRRVVLIRGHERDSAARIHHRHNRARGRIGARAGYGLVTGRDPAASRSAQRLGARRPSLLGRPRASGLK